MNISFRLANVFLSACSLCFFGCATIVKDDSQPVSFGSEPDGALVRIDSVSKGKTPTTIMVERQMGEVIVSFELEGYKTETFPLDESISAMTLGNIVFGGVIGLAVDASTGKNTNYVDSVHVDLIPLSRIEGSGAESSAGETGVQAEDFDLKRDLMVRYQKGEISAVEFIEQSKSYE